MSLINDMLRDLDRRHGGTGGLPNEVRPLPPVRARSRWRPLALALGGVLAVAGWLHFSEVKTQAPAVATTAATAGAPMAPVAKPIAPPPAPAGEAATDEPAGTQALAATPGGLRLDASLSQLPQTALSSEKLSSAAAVKPPAAQTRPAQSIAAKTTEQVAAGPKPAEKGVQPASPENKPAPAETPAAAGGIEKRPRIETPKERAEQDYRKAYSLLSKGRTEEAVPLLKSALAEDAGHVSARLALAGVLSPSGRPDEALALLDEGLQLDPSRPALALAAARLHVAQGRFDQAAGILSRAAPSAQGDAEFRAYRAAVLQRLTLHKEAVAEYQAAVRLVPQAGVWWMGLGISLEADGRGAEARDALQRAKATGTLSPELAAFVEQKLRQLP